MTNPTPTPTRRSGKHRIGCEVEGCDRQHFGRGYCHTHWYRFRSNGDPLVVRPRTEPGATIGEKNPNWLGDEATYQAIHARMRRRLGPAKNRECIECGSGAKDWAYQYSAVNELFDGETNSPYSSDFADYAPMCVPCHSRLDAKHGRLRVPHRMGSRNTSGYPGVSRAGRGRWRAYAYYDGKQVSAGCFAAVEDAAEAAAQLRNDLLFELETLT